MAGKGILCGGIIATLIDCHCLNTAIAAAYKLEDRELGSDPFLPYATGKLELKLIKPIPLDSPITLKAKIELLTKKKIIISCLVFSNNNICAQGKIVAISVPNGFWKK